MSTSLGGGPSNSPQIPGVDGGAHKKNFVHEKFSDEFAQASNDLSALTRSDSVNDSGSKIISPFKDSDASATAPEENQNRANLFQSSPSLMEVARLFAHHFIQQSEPTNAKNSSESTAALASAPTQTYKGLPDVTIKTDTGNASSTGRFLGTATKADNTRVLDTNIVGGRANVTDLMQYGNRAANNPADTSRITINSPQTAAPIQADLNPLRASNGEVVRTQFGQPLVESMTMTTTNQAGMVMAGKIDFRDVAMANKTHIAQQGLILDAEATRMNPGLVVLLRQDAARIAYHPYIGPDNSVRAQTIAISSQDGLRRYFYENQANPGLATTIIDSVRDEHGFPLQQERVRQGTSDTFVMTQYKVMADGHKIQVGKPETERYVQTRVDGQIVYQRYVDPKDVRLPPGTSRTDKSEILSIISQDKTWLVANDLSSAKRQFLEATKGRLFGGNDAKTAHYIDMYVTRIRDHRNLGYTADSDDQLAASLRDAAYTFTAKRTGTAAQMTDASMVRHTEDMLRTMGDPPRYVNQGQVGSCFVVSLIIAAMYTSSHHVIDKWKSILTTGQTTDGKARFTAAELNRANHKGETPFDFLMVSACYKKRAGPNAKLGGMGSGTDDMQASREYRWLTNGRKLPMSVADYKRDGVQMGFTPGHARTYIAVLKNGKVTKYFNNTWDGAGEKPSPIPHVETLTA